MKSTTAMTLIRKLGIGVMGFIISFLLWESREGRVSPSSAGSGLRVCAGRLTLAGGLRYPNQGDATNSRHSDVLGSPRSENTR